MRGLIVMAMFVASLANAAWNEYTDVLHLQLSADGIAIFDVNTGAGDVTIKGLPDADDIIAEAIIRVPREDADSVRKVISAHLQLLLNESGDSARLKLARSRTARNLPKIRDIQRTAASDPVTH